MPPVGNEPADTELSGMATLNQEGQALESKGKYLGKQPLGLILRQS